MNGEPSTRLPKDPRLPFTIPYMYIPLHVSLFTSERYVIFHVSTLLFKPLYLLPSFSSLNINLSTGLLILFAPR